MKEIRLSEWIGEGFYDIHRDIRVSVDVIKPLPDPFA